jgi:anti-sigma regulatory factor (Ser/Thr protein kinase)
MAAAMTDATPRSHVKRFPPPLRQNEAFSSIRLTALPTAPFLARRHTRRILGEWRLGAETIETAELLVSELVTNAAKFAGELPAGLADPDLTNVGVITAALRYMPDRLVIEVSDSDSNPPAASRPELDSESGRGLMLVQALSKEWSYFFPPSGGKVVYCVLSTASALLDQR